MDNTVIEPLRGLVLALVELLQQLSPQLPVAFDVLVVLTVVAITLALFVLQPVSIDTTAIALMVTLIVLEPWTGVTAEAGVSGFSNPATLTVLAMFVLTEGVRQTGVIQILTGKMVAFAGDDEFRQLVATVGFAGPLAGLVNNTPTVAVLIPAVKNLARKTGTSASNLLMPLSFASMMGGMLTTIGTSTSLLASDTWVQVGGPTAEPFSLFEFTKLGAIVLVVGIAYLLTVGRYLVPERVPAGQTPVDQFEVADYLTDVVVREESDFVGSQVRDVRTGDIELDVYQIVRDGRTISRHLANEQIQAGDVLSVKASQAAIEQVLDENHLALLDGNDTDESQPGEPVPSDDRVNRPPPALDTAEPDGESSTADATDGPSDETSSLTEVVVLPGVWANRRNGIDEFEREYDTTVLAIRHKDEVLHQRLRRITLRAGDLLVVQMTDNVKDRLQGDRDLVISSEEQWDAYDWAQAPVALGIVACVVGMAAVGFLPIMVSALAGVVAMLFTGILRPSDAYDAVDWDVIFLIAGVIPLGIAFEASGTADLIATGVVAGSAFLPAIAILAAFYLGTAVITEVLSNNASVVLMLPIAVKVAGQIGANPFAFAIAVTFAASTPLLSPVGYQTNLMVYGPGGYKFTDFARVGAPLQLLLTVATTAGIVLLWGL
ncbi:SLC13 family permease [Halobacteria archaeon HArc-gm2]|nr:SLC13 family permease [Halobacteria archaeon HArc-gm2]